MNGKWHTMGKDWRETERNPERESMILKHCFITGRRFCIRVSSICFYFFIGFLATLPLLLLELIVRMFRTKSKIESSPICDTQTHIYFCSSTFFLLSSWKLSKLKWSTSRAFWNVCCGLTSSIFICFYPPSFLFFCFATAKAEPHSPNCGKCNENEG